MPECGHLLDLPQEILQHSGPLLREPGFPGFWPHPWTDLGSEGDPRIPIQEPTFLRSANPFMRPGVAPGWLRIGLHEPLVDRIQPAIRLCELRCRRGGGE